MLPTDHERIVMALAEHGMDCRKCAGVLSSPECQDGNYLFLLYLESLRHLGILKGRI